MFHVYKVDLVTAAYFAKVAALKLADEAEMQVSPLIYHELQIDLSAPAAFCFRLVCEIVV